MGKTFRKNDAQPISYSWSSPHSRGFAKRNKRKHQHSLRNKNRNKDEMTIDYYQNSPFTLKFKRWSNYKHNTKVIPTLKIMYDYEDEIKTEYFDEISEIEPYERSWFNMYSIPRIFYYKKINWKDNKVNHKDFVEHIIENSISSHQMDDMKIRKKQIERRGKEGIFKGHR